MLPHIEQYAVGPVWDQAKHLGVVMDEAFLAFTILSSNQLCSA